MLTSYLDPSQKAVQRPYYIEFPIENNSEALQANAFYFNHPEWAQEYLDYCHRDELFKERWLHATGGLTGKTVVDIGCGPGNVFASLQGKPSLLIGVDVAPYALKLAAGQGYQAVLADAHSLPFISGFADLVILNAALHHTEHMDRVLTEAARLVKPGGMLISDHDPQQSAWDYKGLALTLWNLRLHIYKILKHSFHKDKVQQEWALKSEIHHTPGHGVSCNFFKRTLTPLGFDVDTYPHNHTVGKALFDGIRGRAQWKYRLANWLSCRHPDRESSALSIMCIAKKK